MLGQRSSMLSRPQFVLVMTYCYNRLTRAVPMTKTTDSSIVSLFLDNWIVPYEIPKHVLTDDRIQSISNFFESLCAFLGSNHLTRRITTCRHTNKLSLSTRQLWHDWDTTWLTMIETGTYTCSLRRTRIIPRCIDQQICRPFVSFHHDTPLDPQRSTILQPFRLMQQLQHPARNESNTTPPCRDSAPRR